MFRRAHPFALAALIVFAPSAALAQMQWQPARPPLVTAENTAWFQGGDAIEWNGDVYYPAGAAQGFNAYQMVRSGSYRGIPLYIDATLEPYSVVFVPLGGGRMQPYERRRSGSLAGTTGSRTPSLPTGVSTEPIVAGAFSGISGESQGAVAQAPAPPMLGPSYEPEPGPLPQPTGMLGGIEPAVAPVSEPRPAGTSGRVNSGRPAPSTMTSVIPPTGVNAIWITFDGRQWAAAGDAIDYDAASLEEIGSYRGFTVYRRAGDPSIIYVPSRPGRLAPYKRR